MSSAELDAEEAIASEPPYDVADTRVNGERRQGKELRETTARRAHATWEPAGRMDPMERLAATCVGRVKQLVPIRFGRMLESPLAFFRGAPLIMARDLSATARTGVLVQACGDAHLMNFGLFASPERNLLFDINDFDETLQGPWEWDLKRLAASIVVASRTYRHPIRSGSDCALACGRAYRQNILCYSKRPLLNVWYSRVDGENVLKEYQRELRKRIARKIDKAEKCDQRNAVSELAEDEGGCLKFVENPPILTHESDELSERGLDRILKSYRRSLQDDRRHLFDGYQLVDFALKVVGVGSVGTRCFAALFRSGRKNDCIVLQIKEATPSVFEGLAKTNWNGNQGQRTVVGQRLIQGFTDIFLGWGSDGERDFYVRQLRDMKGQLSAQTSSVDELEHYAGLCGWTLARAHARSGNSALIAGYLGKSDVFDKALAEFSVSYADQVERDFDVFKAALKEGFPLSAEFNCLYAKDREQMMGLTEYRQKRDFRVTGEPRGGRVSSHKKLSFVIQKHAASHLHYDFRLELDGVLKSWAVPKGPSLDPATKRLAMQVEDHPLEYGGFEGIIPPGEYGGGTVMLWDQGAWEPVGDAKQGYREGALKFILHGEKLEGGWMLVRKGGKRAGSDERHWFLFKERDEFANPSLDITEESPMSVTTGRDLDAIAKQAKRVWGRNGEVSKNGHKRPAAKVGAKPKLQSVSKKSVVANKTDITKALKAVNAKKVAFPSSLEVQLATLTKDAPDGDDWIHEIKFDGYRMLCRIERGKVRFISRNGRDWTAKFPTLAKAVAALPLKTAIIDGEVVVMQPDGTTSFQALQNSFQSARTTPFQFYCFDLLYLDGFELRDKPIEDRKSLLARIIPSGSDGLLHFSDHVVGNGPKCFAEASRLHLEGIISKRLGRPYSAGRGLDWLKIKCSLREEFVIGGFTAPSGSRTHFGALAIGYYDEDHQLKYAGRVGTGFDERTLGTLHAKLAKLAQKMSPFSDLSGSTGQARGVTWVKPSLVAQIEFSNWTNERQLRHPSFQGLREDKPAKDVVRDDPISAPAVESTKKVKHVAKSKTATKGTAPRSLHPKKSSNADGEVAGVRLSHPDKILYPEDGITKLDLAKYYEQVSKWMLPHVENRLLSLVRCPAGSGQKCFFQKHPGEGTSEHLRRFEVSEKSKTEEYLALYDVEGLVSLVQMGVLEIHLWGSQADQFEKPDRLIFDLDPDPSVSWPHVVTAALEVRLLLEELDLTSFVKTTGGKGLHIVVPIRRRTSWSDAKTFCRAVADLLVAAAPDRYIATMSKAARKGKIFVDYLRNDRGATAIAPYSTRARPGAPVSVPLTWDELSDKISSNHFNVQNLPERLSRLKKDPWAAIQKTEQGITVSMLGKLKVR